MIWLQDFNMHLITKILHLRKIDAIFILNLFSVTIDFDFLYYELYTRFYSETLFCLKITFTNYDNLDE